MQEGAPGARLGEYATRGEYHRTPDPHWDYYPTYQAKLRLVRAYLDRLPRGTRVLDAGCGEGVLVDEYSASLDIHGVDPQYSSGRVQLASITALPFPDARFDRALCLDVLEHLSFDDQRKALDELKRVLVPEGELVVTVPNLAHLQSRIHFLLRGRLIRTASEQKHPGDRPIAEYLALVRAAGFELVARRGIFPTIPVLTRLIRRHPQTLASLHRLLTRLIPVPGWCFLNLLVLRKPAGS
ncbi:MAG: methyltransferase domain-containing protein [Acidobacteria bacterium]|nr:methyltransferase domain-containing protein [Acidobacteriota bacterium]